MNFERIDNEAGYLLIRTYILCLSDDAIQQLIDECHNIKKSNTLFDYPTYLKELHIGNVQASITCKYHFHKKLVQQQLWWCQEIL